jgi:glycosyltransferase family 11
MIISEFIGGFGNQLFEYACAYAQARRMNTKLVLDSMLLATDTLRNYELDSLSLRYDFVFRIPHKYPYIIKVALRKCFHFLLRIIAKNYKERKAYVFDDKIYALSGNWRLRGYWQSEKYFKDYRDEIVSMFTPTYPMTTSFLKLKKQIESTNSVAVHVRRGDYVALGICLSDVYYREALLRICQKVNDPVFYVFSDDMEYAKQLFAEFVSEQVVPVCYEGHNSTIEDFLLMKSCKHNIMANSSYSWWAAWANVHEDKIVVAPKRENKDDFYPEEWIQV